MSGKGKLLAAEGIVDAADLRTVRMPHRP